MADYPDELRELVDDYLGGLSFGDDRETAGLEEAMAYSLLAGGKRVRPVLCLATARSAGADPGVGPSRCGSDRAGPYVLAHPRRPAGDGRRRPAAGKAHVAQEVRRGRGDSRRRRALRRSDQPLPLRAGRRARERGRGASLAGGRDRCRRHGRRPVHRRRRERRGCRWPAQASRLEDRPPDRRKRPRATPPHRHVG